MTEFGKKDEKIRKKLFIDDPPPNTDTYTTFLFSVAYTTWVDNDLWNLNASSNNKYTHTIAWAHTSEGNTPVGPGSSFAG
jgi:hypothetical protein